MIFGDKNTKKKTAIAASLLAFFLTACTESGTDTEKVITEEDRESIYYHELVENYIALDILYYDAHLKNELNSDPDVYYNVLFKADFTKGACTSRYADVCGMYNQMSDKFTRYFDPNFSEDILKALNESPEQVGMGIQVKEEDGHVILTDIFPQSPAYYAGLQVGDTITTINNLLVSGIEDFDKYASGQKLDILYVTYRREDGPGSTHVQLDTYNAPTVFLSYQGDIPVITITEFTPTTIRDDGTYGEYHAALQKIVDSGAKSVIIDLRDNGGGELEHCLSATTDLLKKGSHAISIVETAPDSVIQGRTFRYIQKFDTTRFYADADGIGKDLYSVILANENTASCSEFMMAALASNKATPIVGKTTYGKGIGQTYNTTSAGGIFGITYAHVLDKNNSSYHGVGIVPDHIISDYDKQMAKAVEIATLRTEKRTAGYGKESTGNFDKEAFLENSANAWRDRNTIRKGAGLYTRHSSNISISNR